MSVRNPIWGERRRRWSFVTIEKENNFTISLYEIFHWRREAKGSNIESDKNWRVQENGKLLMSFNLRLLFIPDNKFRMWWRQNAINMTNCEDEEHILKFELMWKTTRKKVVIEFSNSKFVIKWIVLCNYCLREGFRQDE